MARKKSFRIGKKTGMNLSKKGVSFSSRTKFGTVSSRKGRSTGLFKLLDGCIIPTITIVLTIFTVFLFFMF